MTTRQFLVNSPDVVYLKQTDPLLEKLIQSIGSVYLALEDDGFCCLVQYIIGQQISDKSRATIWNKVLSTLDTVNPETVLKIGPSVLRKFGLTEKKADCIRTLATKILNGDLVLENHTFMSNEEIIQNLIAIKGIGRWTAEMYLIFSLGRENVLSLGDGTIKRTIRWLYDLNEDPSAKTIKQYFSKWAGYETIVSLFLWAANSQRLSSKPVRELFSSSCPLST